MAKKVISCAAILLLAIVVIPISAKAATTTQSTSTDLTVLLQMIETLKSQIAELQVKIAELKQAQAAVKETLMISRQLIIGMSGDDVKLLQELLATDPDIYPESLITGYFGPLTEKAVKKFQQKMGVEQAGNVGPKTISKINELLNEGAGKSGKVPPGLLIAPGIQKKIGYVPIPPTGQVLPPGIAKKIGQATTSPDITSPVISAVSATNTQATSSRIVWTTDEPANSKVYYSTTTLAEITTSTALVSDSSFVSGHSVLLNGLIASTAYYYLVVSSDASGNTATSAEFSFTTLAESDTVAPVISNVSVSDITTSSANVNWTTDEPADSSVYYSTTSPATTDSNVIHTDGGGLLLTHSVGLVGLNATTTYYYFVSSKDDSSNIGTSTDYSFTTLSE